MCSTVLINSFRIINKNPIPLQYGKRISAIAVHRRFRYNNKFKACFNSGAGSVKKLLLQNIPSPVLTNRMYFDVPQKTSDEGASKEKESQEIVKNVGKDKDEESLKQNLENAIKEQVQEALKENMSSGLKAEDILKENITSGLKAEEILQLAYQVTTKENTEQNKTQKENSSPGLKEDILQLSYGDATKQSPEQDKPQKQGSKMRFYYYEFERILYLFIAASIDAYYAILASNELKIIRLSGQRAYNWLRERVQKHVVENPKVQNKLNEVKANVEKARRADSNKS